MSRASVAEDVFSFFRLAMKSVPSRDRRAARRVIVRRWECDRYDVRTYGIPTADEVTRSRVLGRDLCVDRLARRAEELGGMSALWLADRLRVLLATSAVAEEIEPPEGQDWIVAWTYHDDCDGPTPRELARRVRERRECR